MFGSLGVPVGLFWVAWTARPGVHWASPVVAAVPFAWGNLSVFTAAALYLVDVYGHLNGASALAANGLVLQHMEEPAPPPGFLARAAEYEAAATIPRLLLVRTVKQDGPSRSLSGA